MIIRAKEQRPTKRIKAKEGRQCKETSFLMNIRAREQIQQRRIPSKYTELKMVKINE